MSKPHLSKSQLEMLGKCGAQYEWRYIRGVKKPPGVALIIGTGTHAATEKDLRSKLEWGELLSEEEVKDAAAEAVKQRWQAEAPVRAEDDPDEGGAVDEAVSLATVYHRELAPAIAPVAIEEARRIALDGFPYDLELITDVEEAVRIRDTKTASKAPADANELTIQGAIETLDAKLRGTPKPFVRDVLIKGKRPRALTTPEIHATEDDHRALLLRVEAASRIIEAGAFAPTNPDNWWCSARWCGYYGECPHGARRQVSVGLIDPSRLTSKASELRRRAA